MLPHILSQLGEVDLPIWIRKCFNLLLTCHLAKSSIWCIDQILCSIGFWAREYLVFTAIKFSLDFLLCVELNSILFLNVYLWLFSDWVLGHCAQCFSFLELDLVRVRKSLYTMIGCLDIDLLHESIKWIFIFIFCLFLLSLLLLVPKHVRRSQKGHIVAFVSSSDLAFFLIEDIFIIFVHFSEMFCGYIKRFNF